MYTLAVFLFLVAQTGARPIAALELRLEGPPELTAIRTRLESMDPRRFGDISRLVGIVDAGPAIQVVLARENSDLARRVPAWISGFAVGGSDSVVIFPERSPSYPDNTLEDVLRHEVAHVLIWRASAGRPIPRWFNEGVAMAAERERRFQDQTQLLYQLVTGSRTSLDELDRLFSGGQKDQTRAYALAGALVRDVLKQSGPDACGEILKRVRDGARFDSAFADVTGRTPAGSESEFWRSQRVWTTWVPIVTSATSVWLAIALLAILAIYMRRRRNRQIEKRWAEEERIEAASGNGETQRHRDTE
jgi:hypothetical protein